MADVESTATSPRIETTPHESLMDEPVRIRLVGLPPNEIVSLHARMQDAAKRWWESRTTFRTDAHGIVDLSAQAPVSGSYEGVDAMGFLWSMAAQPGESADVPFRKAGLEPSVIELTAEVDGVPVAIAELVRLSVSHGVTRTPVRDKGLVGTLFAPSGPGPFPAIIVVGGSGGGLFEGTAALFASRGYAALALAYFNAEHLPAELVRIPLEYFETAIQWLQAQDSVIPEELALCGTSRGGELVLLLGATYPAVKAVIGYVPSSVVNGAVAAATKANRDAEKPQPAWTYRGEALLSFPSVGSQVLGPELTPAFLRALDDVEQVERATIPVERINGPVLLISGQDDAMWPSAVFSERIMERLAEHHHPYPDQHLCYDRAGHTIGPPYGPTTITHTHHPVRGVLRAFGGTAKGTAYARADSWPHVLGFLERHLKRGDEVDEQYNH